MDLTNIKMEDVAAIMVPVRPLGDLSDEEIAVCDAAASKVYKDMSGHLAGAIETFTSEIHEAVRITIECSLENDTSYNFRSLVEGKANTIMRGLLNEGAANTGWQTGEARKYLTGFQFEEFRAQVYAAHRDAIQNQLIDDLTRDNARLRSSLKSYEERY